MALLVAAVQDEHRCHGTGEDAGPGNTVHAHTQHKDADRIAHDVDDVHQDADLHGDFGVTHAAEERRTGIVHGQERVADRRDAQVEHTGLQYVGIDAAIAQPDHGTGQHKAEHPHTHAQQSAEQDQLTRACVGVLLLLCTQILADHHRAAGGQRRKQHDDEVVDHIHQTDTRDGGFAAAGDHHGIGHAHRHGQQLLHQQRPHQPEQVTLAEQRGPPAKARGSVFCDRMFHSIPRFFTRFLPFRAAERPFLIDVSIITQPHPVVKNQLLQFCTHAPARACFITLPNTSPPFLCVVTKLLFLLEQKNFFQKSSCIFL